MLQPNEDGHLVRVVVLVLDHSLRLSARSTVSAVACTLSATRMILLLDEEDKCGH